MVKLHLIKRKYVRHSFGINLTSCQQMWNIYMFCEMNTNYFTSLICEFYHISWNSFHYIWLLIVSWHLINTLIFRYLFSLYTRKFKFITKWTWLNRHIESIIETFKECSVHSLRVCAWSSYVMWFAIKGYLRYNICSHMSRSQWPSLSCFCISYLVWKWIGQATSIFHSWDWTAWACRGWCTLGHYHATVQECS